MLNHFGLEPNEDRWGPFNRDPAAYHDVCHSASETRGPFEGVLNRYVGLDRIGELYRAKDFRFAGDAVSSTAERFLLEEQDLFGGRGLFRPDRRSPEGPVRAILVVHVSVGNLIINNGERTRVGLPVKLAFLASATA
jgi:hypothetical protein